MREACNDFIEALELYQPEPPLSSPRRYGPRPKKASCCPQGDTRGLPAVAAATTTITPGPCANPGDEAKLTALSPSSTGSRRARRTAGWGGRRTLGRGRQGICRRWRLCCHAPTGALPARDR